MPPMPDVAVVTSHAPRMPTNRPCPMVRSKVWMVMRRRIAAARSPAPYQDGRGQAGQPREIFAVEGGGVGVGPPQDGRPL